MDLSDFVLARLAEGEQRFDAEELPYLDEAERRGVTDHDIRHMSAMTVTKIMKAGVDVPRRRPPRR